VAFPGNNRQTKVVEYRAEVLALNRRRVPAGVLMLIRYPLAGEMLCVVCIVFSVSITIAAECHRASWKLSFREVTGNRDLNPKAISSGIEQSSNSPAARTSP
jgi:hypothetical protein